MNANHTNSNGAEPMTYIDPHAHMISRTTDDYEAMARAGVVAVIEPAFWIGQARTNQAGQQQDNGKRMFEITHVHLPISAAHIPAEEAADFCSTTMMKFFRSSQRFCGRRTCVRRTPLSRSSLIRLRFFSARFM